MIYKGMLLNVLEQTPEKIVYWYDYHTKSWVIQVMDINGYEIASEYVGNKNSLIHCIEYDKRTYGVNVVIHLK